MRRALITLALALVRPACCMKEQLSIEDDYRRIVVIDNFGFHTPIQSNAAARQGLQAVQLCRQVSVCCEHVLAHR
eukprot:COSAG03_NODE_17155_length_382_cov_1.459364_1_plen_74_part_10